MARTESRACPTPEKVCYHRRKQACEAACRLRMVRCWVHEYHCGCGAWHVGHLPGLNTVPGPTFDPRTGRNL